MIENEKIPFIWNIIVDNSLTTTGSPYIEKDGHIKKIYYRKSVTNNKVKFDSICEIDNELVKYDSRTGITEYGDQIYIEIVKTKKPKFIRHNYDLIWFYSNNISEDQWGYISDLIQDEVDVDTDICPYHMIKPNTYYYYDFLTNDFEELDANINILYYGLEIK